MDIKISHYLCDLFIFDLFFNFLIFSSLTVFKPIKI